MGGGFDSMNHHGVTYSPIYLNGDLISLLSNIDLEDRVGRRRTEEIAINSPPIINEYCNSSSRFNSNLNKIIF